MSDHPIEGMMNTTLEKIKQMVDVNSIVGDPITAPDGTIIIPDFEDFLWLCLRRLGFRLQERCTAKKNLFGGGTGAGIYHQCRLRFLTISRTAMSSFCRSIPYNSSADRDCRHGAGRCG